MALPLLLPLIMDLIPHNQGKGKSLFCTLPYLVDLPIGAIPNQFDQLKDTSWVLGVKERQESGR